MENKSARAKVQAFGGFLTAMVIPNIGAFIAWGFITALFIPTGWLPNEHFAKIVGPMITYLLPVMIGSTGGHLVGGKRGAVMGGIGTIGVIVGAEIPMFLGSMIMGPLGGLVIKYVDKALEKRIPAGFEMVINNFSLGIAGMLLCLLGFEVIGPAVLIANTFVKECIEALVHAGYLPLLSVINEPAKVLFLNNAIDQGVYYPLGMQQASVNGKSIFFMVASNPGPGLGLLLAFTLFGKGMSKRSAPGAMIIHFLGGIHELYFPYVLMKPLTIIAMIAGGMSGTWMFNLLDGGLVAGPSPGSIFAYLALTPKGSFLATIAGVTVGTLVSFAITSLILKMEKTVETESEDEFAQSANAVKAMKQEGAFSLSRVKRIAFVCAPPGTGKSTLTTFWEYLAQQDPELPAIQTLPMDGFHHYNSWLDAHQLRPFKGAPETFDVAKLTENLRQVVEGDCTWPQYDRQKHDPVEDALHVTAPLVIVEGNWLLLDDEKWLELASFCDFSIFIHAPAQILRERLISRKIAGGLTRQVAEAFYARTDGPNVERVLMNSRQANLIVEMTEEGRYHFTS
ncbi:nucleoside/nucleotide kinase family protein [Escherichia coli]|nr:nucleoside/nucleotide kinase family protein [Escherichia coli]